MFFIIPLFSFCMEEDPYSEDPFATRTEEDSALSVYAMNRGRERNALRRLYKEGRITEIRGWSEPLPPRNPDLDPSLKDIIMNIEEFISYEDKFQSWIPQLEKKKAKKEKRWKREYYQGFFVPCVTGAVMGGLLRHSDSERYDDVAVVLGTGLSVFVGLGFGAWFHHLKKDSLWQPDTKIKFDITKNRLNRVQEMHALMQEMKQQPTQPKRSNDEKIFTFSEYRTRPGALINALLFACTHKKLRIGGYDDLFPSQETKPELILQPQDFLSYKSKFEERLEKMQGTMQQAENVLSIILTKIKKGWYICGGAAVGMGISGYLGRNGALFADDCPFWKRAVSLGGTVGFACLLSYFATNNLLEGYMQKGWLLFHTKKRSEKIKKFEKVIGKMAELEKRQAIA